MMDDYDRTELISGYISKGIILGAVAGLIGGVCAQEYLAEPSGEIARYLLDVLSGIGGVVIGVPVGYAAGMGLGHLVNKMIEDINNNKK